MTLRGMDIAGSQMAGDTSTLTGRAAEVWDECDFVICKATQGTSYVASYFPDVLERGLAEGKLMGVYHYASGDGTAYQQAQWLWEKVRSWSGHVLVALDFEQAYNQNYGNKDFAYIFAATYNNLSGGVWPVVYCGAHDVWRVKSAASKCGLWVAGWPDTRIDSWDAPAFPYGDDLAPWSTWTIWQYTNSRGRLDRDVANLTRDGWERIARGGSFALSEAENVVREDISGQSDAHVARRVINGEFGSGAERRALLGSRYEGVQGLVNAILGQSDSVLAGLVIRGDFGTGDERRYILGPRYDAVQKIVNRRLSK